jgi:cysteinyl-tRNA synthetase
MVLRIALMSHHYRSGFEWHNSMLEPSKQLLCGLRSATAGEAGQIRDYTLQKCARRWMTNWMSPGA